MNKMKGAILPGNSTVELKEFDIPAPGHGEVLIKMNILDRARKVTSPE
jgi:D-arabinose 1-dehydrogenase-like Zn-dependent alcohol dehydrogenase